MHYPLHDHARRGGARRHHNHIDNDYSHPWITPEKIKLPGYENAKNLEENAWIRILLPFFSWPLYLLGLPDGSHFFPFKNAPFPDQRLYAEKTPARESAKCLFSTATVAAFAITLYKALDGDLWLMFQYVSYRILSRPVGSAPHCSSPPFPRRHTHTPLPLPLAGLLVTVSRPPPALCKLHFSPCLLRPSHQVLLRAGTRLWLVAHVRHLLAAPRARFGGLQRFQLELRPSGV